ncbi:MAG TPA: Fe-S protein assembly co-chaperone HscB [Blastocatellia bacterium]|nr:Fe-S protein assembly co-chaperone HscB [Blastocatellia bacterium]
MAEEAVNTGRDLSCICAHCGAAISAVHFCSECGKIQILSPDVDHFQFLELPRKLVVDDAALEKSFYSLSRQFHPDYFMSATELEKRASLERSSRLNDAYRTLRDRIARITYLLALEGYKESEKKAPPDLLEEVFESNMAIEEIKAAKRLSEDNVVVGARLSLETALDGLQQKLGEIDGQLTLVSQSWDDAVDQCAEQNRKTILLDRMSELLSHRSYIRHLVRAIQEEL